MTEMHTPALFGQLLVVFMGSLVSVVLFQRLRLPDTLAYLFTGALIGPFGLHLVQDSGDIKFLSELGLVFLLFELGLGFSVPRLLSLRRSVFGLGSLQVGMTILLFASIASLPFEQPWQTAWVVAGALALSSTALVIRELQTLKLINRHHAQLAVGVLLFQDLAAVVGLILIQAFGGKQDVSIYEQIAWTFEKGVVLILILMSVGKWVLPRVFHEVARTRSDEVFVLTVLVIILLSAWLTSAFGLSMALGAFLIGVMLGENEFRHQVELDIRPFKDILMGLFFASVGMQLDLGLLKGNGAVIVTVGLCALIVLKTLVTTSAAMLMGEPLSTSLKTGVILAQASEFGFALMILAQTLGVVSAEIGSFVLLIALGSLIPAPWLIRYSFEISQWVARGFGQHETPREREFKRIPAQLTDHVIVAGYGRVGQMIAKFLQANGIPLIVLDTDAMVVKRARTSGVPIIYGSCHRIDLLKRCQIERARLAILTLRSLQEAQRVVSRIRELGYTVPILVRTQHEGDYADLLAAGADYVVPEMLESSLMMAAEVLDSLGFPKTMIDEQIAAERRRHKRAHKEPQLGPGA